MYYSEQIEAYLRSELSAEERQIFEEMIRRDPLLKNELDLQNDIVQSIQNYRKNQLKARLNQIQVDSAYSPTNGYKAAGIALAGLLIVGSLGYLAYDRFLPEKQQSVSQLASDKSVKTDMQPDSIYENKEEDKTASPAVKDGRSVSKDFEVKKQEALTNKQTTLPQPNVKEPEISSNDESIEKKPENVTVPTGDLTPLPATKNAKGIQVSVINKDPKYQFHYSFSEGKLVLYGEFEQLYEILDFNSKEGKQVYLFYQENFFKLNENQAIAVPLVKVNNPQLIKKLKEAQQHNK
jgi:hypothetical protein